MSEKEFPRESLETETKQLLKDPYMVSLRQLLEANQKNGVVKVGSINFDKRSEFRAYHGSGIKGNVLRNNIIATVIHRAIEDGILEALNEKGETIKVKFVEEAPKFIRILKRLPEELQNLS